MAIYNHSSKLEIDGVYDETLKGADMLHNYLCDINKFGIVLKGKCKKCGHNVARVVEDK